MRTYKPQVGYVYEGRDGKAFHIRYYTHDAGVRKQRSVKLCAKDDLHPSKDAPAVVALAEAFISKINTANGEVSPGHNCTICGHRCPRTLRGTFAPKETKGSQAKCV
jgi:hypothetical protein